MFNSYGQVTIGATLEPEKGAILEIKEKQSGAPSETNIPSLENSTKGILFPRVKLVAYDQLAPLYGMPSGNPDNKTRLCATGMVVYNINKDAVNLNVGFYYWDGKQWKKW